MRSSDLKPEQVRQLVRGIQLHAAYFNRLMSAMDRAYVPLEDPLYVRAKAARSACDTLRVFVESIGTNQAAPPKTSVNMTR